MAIAGLWHAGVPYFLVWYTWREDPILVQSGRMMGVYAFGTVICQIIVFVVNIKVRCLNIGTQLSNSCLLSSESNP